MRGVGLGMWLRCLRGVVTMTRAKIGIVIMKGIVGLWCRMDIIGDRRAGRRGMVEATRVGMGAVGLLGLLGMGTDRDMDTRDMGIIMEISRRCWRVGMGMGVIVEMREKEKEMGMGERYVIMMRGMLRLGGRGRLLGFWCVTPSN